MHPEQEDEPKAYKVIRTYDHDWKIEGPTGGPGPQYYWICRSCGSSGGPSFLPWEQLEVKRPKWDPFLAGTPLIELPIDNCGEAKKRIDAFVEKYPEWKVYVERARGIEPLA